MHDDLDFFGLSRQAQQGEFRFTVTEHLARLDGRLYGGSAIGVSIAAAEAVSDRPALWMTTQFVSTVDLGSDVDVLAEILAGRRTNQVRITATGPSGDVVFASLGATGVHRPDGLTGQFERRPTVTSPAEAEPWDSPFSGLLKAAGIDSSTVASPQTGFVTAIEMREPEVLDHPDAGPGRVCLWVRRRDGGSVTPALAGYIADVGPMGIAYALRVLARGTSLDNTLRIGPVVETEWILLDLRPHLAVGGYGHGVAHVWSEDGQLIATASQTASMVAVGPESLPSFRVSS